MFGLEVTDVFCEVNETCFARIGVLARFMHESELLHIRGLDACERRATDAVCSDNV